MEKVIENIKKYGNKNSCYIPFEGGGYSIRLVHKILSVQGFCEYVQLYQQEIIKMPNV